MPKKSPNSMKLLQRSKYLDALKKSFCQKIFFNAKKKFFREKKLFSLFHYLWKLCFAMKGTQLAYRKKGPHCDPRTHPETKASG